MTEQTDEKAQLDLDPQAAARLGYFVAAFFTASHELDADALLHGREWVMECIERRVADLRERPGEATE